jgi:glycerol-3-phosphate O-acyltransferase / dihydroxyacetone phosphate acyltransferase
MLYACVRAVVALALRLFFRVQVQGASSIPDGPVLLLGNHPNGLVDPALIFVVTRRPVTFLAKAPLFTLPVLGWVLRGMGALPVFRRQDDPARMGDNEGTFQAATQALTAGGAITLFPEGKSHDAPRLAELRTGAARIALRAVRAGAPVRVVPVGLTYAQKHQFRSAVRVEVGPAFEVASFLPEAEAGPEGETEVVRRLTEAMAHALGQVTLNLETWEDLPLAQTAGALWALRHAPPAGDAERLRRFARGVAVLRHAQPSRFAALREELLRFRRRLGRVHATPADLMAVHAPAALGAAIVRHLLGLLLGLPLCALGLLLFALPYQVPGWVAGALRTPLDVQATVKLAVTLVLAPLWVALLAAVGAWAGGPAWGVAALLGAPLLALLTRGLLEHWREVLRDGRLLLTLGGRAHLKALLRAEAERLAAEVAQAAGELGGRTDAPLPAAVARP